MDEKKQIKNFVDMMDTYMSNGGGHVKINEVSKDILTKDNAESKDFSELAKMSSTCPECANIPNISDVDGEL